MHLGINALFLQRPMTGTGQYTLRLVGELPSLLEDGPITLLGGRARQWRSGPGRQVRVRGFGPRMDGRLHDLTKLWWEQIGLPVQARMAGVDLLHTPYWAGPVVASVPVVMTIHDVIPALLPAYRGSWAVRAYTSLVTRAARRAAAVIVDSQCSRSDAIRLLGLRPERVHVVHLAAAERFQPRPEGAYAAHVSVRWGIAGPFFLYLGATDIRKDIPTVIRAWARIADRLPTHTLLLGGSTPPHSSDLFPDLPRLASELGVEQQVRFLGSVSEEEQVELLRDCLAFLFPSRYEGFGLPPLEAMACGAPVIVANASSLPEVVGDAGLLFTPGADEELAAHIERIATEPAERRRRSHAGIARARYFSWQRTALQTVGVYRHVTNR